MGSKMSEWRMYIFTIYFCLFKLLFAKLHYLQESVRNRGSSQAWEWSPILQIKSEESISFHETCSFIDFPCCPDPSVPVICDNHTHRYCVSRIRVPLGTIVNPFWSLLLSNCWHLKLVFGNSDSILCHLCILSTFTTTELEIVIRFSEYFVRISSLPFSPWLL